MGAQGNIEARGKRSRKKVSIKISILLQGKFAEADKRGIME